MLGQMDTAGKGICHIGVGFSLKLMMIGSMFQASIISWEQQKTETQIAATHQIRSNHDRPCSPM
jgi:hypothetical protein